MLLSPYFIFLVVVSNLLQTDVLRWLLFEIGLDVNQVCQASAAAAANCMAQLAEVNPDIDTIFVHQHDAVQGQQLKRNNICWKQWNRQFIQIQGPIVRSIAEEDDEFEGPALAVHLL